MLKFRIERAPSPVWVRPLLPLLAILITFVITSVFILLANANPLTAYYYYLTSPFTNRVSMIEILVKATPLILTGTSVTIAFASGYWNIGAEGQLYAGALAAAWIGTVVGGWHPGLAILAMLLGGFLAGMIWASIPALLKVKLAVDEVVTTLLLNSVIVFIISALLNGPWRDPVSGWPQSPTIADSAVFPKLIPRSRLHLGFLVAVAMVLLIWFILSKTPLGLRMRASGLGQEAARLWVSIFSEPC